MHLSLCSMATNLSLAMLCGFTIMQSSMYFNSYAWGIKTHYHLYLLIHITFWIYCYCYCWSSLLKTIIQLKHCLLMMYGKNTALEAGSRVKYNTPFWLVSYLSFNPIPHTVFSIHHSQWCFNIYIMQWCTIPAKLTNDVTITTPNILHENNYQNSYHLSFPHR